MPTPIRQFNTQTHYLADGVTTAWPFTFTGGYISREHVRAQKRAPVTGAISEITINPDTDLIGEFQLRITPAVESGYELMIYRATPRDLPLVDFTDGSQLPEVNLDIVAKQSIFVAAESADWLGVSSTEDLTALATQAGNSVAAATAAANAASGSATAAAASVTAASNAAADALASKSAAEAAAASAADSAAAISRGAFVVNPKDAPFNAVGNGIADDTYALTVAEAAAWIAGATLMIPPGNFVINSNLTFRCRVRMEGGVFNGSGELAFDAFDAPPYYCLKTHVTRILSDVVRAEWFGAVRGPSLMSSLYGSVVGKSWNRWPDFIRGDNFGSDHDYGDSAFLAANSPFSNTDTADFVGIQRALWALGLVTTGTRGEVGLLGGIYQVSRAVRIIGDMASTLTGTGSQTKTLIYYANRSTHEVQTLDSGTAKILLSFFGVGPDPLVVRDIGFIGPSGYTAGVDRLYPIAMQATNGVTIQDCWVSTGDDLIHLDRGCSDIWIRGCKLEYGANQVRGYDGSSWVQISDCGFWKAGGNPVGVNVAGQAYITGCTFVSHTQPFLLGIGSQVSGTTIIEDGTGYRTRVNDRVISRRMDIAPGQTRVVATFAMAATSALMTTTTVGGVVQTVGSAMLSQKLAWTTDSALPTATVVVAKTPYGNVVARANVDLIVTTTGPSSFSLAVTNSHSAGKTFSADVTIITEGADASVSAIN